MLAEYREEKGDLEINLASSYIHPTPAGGRCRVRIYLPEEGQDAPVILIIELPENPGESVTEAAEHVAAEILHYHDFSAYRLPVFIEHYPRSELEIATGFYESFDLVFFADYEIRETRSADGRRIRARIGDPDWRPLDRPSVEALVGERIFTEESKAGE